MDTRGVLRLLRKSDGQDQKQENIRRTMELLAQHGVPFPMLIPLGYRTFDPDYTDTFWAITYGWYEAAGFECTYTVGLDGTFPLWDQAGYHPVPEAWISFIHDNLGRIVGEAKAQNVFLERYLDTLDRQ